MDSYDGAASDPSEGPMSLLARSLESKFKVRDSLLEEVAEGLYGHADPAARLRALTVVLNSVIVNHGNSPVYDERNQVLSRRDLDRILSPQLLEEKVAAPLVSGEYANELVRESTLLLFAASAYLPPEQYARVYTPELVARLVSIAEGASCT